MRGRHVFFLEYSFCRERPRSIALSKCGKQCAILVSAGEGIAHPNRKPGGGRAYGTEKVFAAARFCILASVLSWILRWKNAGPGMNFRHEKCCTPRVAYRCVIFTFCRLLRISLEFFPFPSLGARVQIWRDFFSFFACAGHRAFLHKYARAHTPYTIRPIHGFDTHTSLSHPMGSFL